ncbi:MAG: hypothetical protein J7621_18025 [Niastella sp.]|nr:hypothetical protein [Niastella sp.]
MDKVANKNTTPFYQRKLCITLSTFVASFLLIVNIADKFWSAFDKFPHSRIAFKLENIEFGQYKADFITMLRGTVYNIGAQTIKIRSIGFEIKYLNDWVKINSIYPEDTLRLLYFEEPGKDKHIARKEMQFLNYFAQIEPNKYINGWQYGTIVPDTSFMEFLRINTSHEMRITCLTTDGKTYTSNFEMNLKPKASIRPY